MCLKVVELSMLPIKLISFEITCLSFNKKSLLIGTKTGDVLEVKLGKERQNISAHLLPSVLPIPSKQRALAYLNDDELPILAFGGESSIVCILDMRNYDLVDLWGVGHHVTAIDLCSTEVSFVIGVGCDDGAILIKQDWDIVSTHHTSSDSVTSLRFSDSGRVLFASSEDSNIYIFKKSEKFFELYSFLTIDAGIPISLDLSEGGQYLLIATDKRKIMVMNTATLELSFTYQEVTAIKWTQFKSHFAVHLKKEIDVTRSEFVRLPVSWDAEADAMAAADASGLLYIWKSKF